jgi:hypothetical protein
MASDLKLLQQRASVVRYASVLPGTGKTLWAIKQLIQRVQGKSGITFYVAPTHQLLREVHTVLERELTPQQMKNQVKLILSGTGDRTGNQIRTALDGTSDQYGLPTQQMKSGSVFLITHATFVSNLPHGYDQDGNPKFERRAEISVIFDEARKCNVSKYDFKMPFSLANAINTRFLDFTPSTPESYSRLRPRKKLDTAEFDALFGDNKGLRKLRERLLNLLQTVDDESVHLYGKISIRDDEEDDDELMTIRMQVLLVPYQIFFGWKECTLLSAFFENSQMYHLLRTRDVSSRSSDESAKEFRQRLARATFEGDHSYIMLKNATDEIVNPKRVQKVMIDSSVFSPKSDFDLSDFFSTYRQLVLERKTETGGKLLPLRVASRYVESGFPDPQPIDKQIVKHLRKLPGLVGDNTPLQWYVRCASYMSRKWQREKGYEILPVPVTVNVGDRGIQNREMRYFATEIKPMFGAKVRELPMQSHGLNRFLRHPTIAFLATLNAAPEVKELFAQLCPLYNADLDHTLDQCIQSLTRCAIRDTRSTVEPLLIVTEKKLAMKVRAQLGMLPKLVPPSHFGIPLKDVTYHLVDEDAKARQRKRRERPSVRIKERAYKDRVDVRARNMARDAYYKQHSEIYRKYKSLSAALARARRENSERVPKLEADFEAIKTQWKVERSTLDAHFQAYYNTSSK